MLAFDERIVGILDCRLKLLLNLDECLRQFTYLIRTKRFHVFLLNMKRPVRAFPDRSFSKKLSIQNNNIYLK